jgi:hypothetical protein
MPLFGVSPMHSHQDVAPYLDSPLGINSNMLYINVLHVFAIILAADVQL